MYMRPAAASTIATEQTIAATKEGEEGFLSSPWAQSSSGLMWEKK